MYALGSLQMDWRVEAGDVRLSFSDAYCWKPDEKRLTQPLHRAAVRLASEGACEFRHVGPLTRVGWDQIIAVKPGRVVALAGMYCM